MTRRHLTIARLLPALAARRAQIGGQAVIEGVMMRGVDWWSLAVRRPDRSIGLHHFPLVSYMKKYPVLRLPVLRGVVALIESLVIGVRALTRSANESLGEEEEELGKKEIGITLVIAFAFAVGLFFIAPLFLTGLLDRWLGDGFLFWLVEGLVRVGIFLAYLVVITRIRDLRRVFEYHGAEHMSIHALEHGEELTVANVEKYRTLHLRCGTSFLLVVLVVSIFVFAAVGRPDWYLLVLSRVVLVPLIAGISYEIIRYAGRHEHNLLVRVVMAPGLGLQWLTTRQPDGDQIEVAIAALEKIVELEPPDRPPVKGVEVMA
ncbi:MAG TPA: DUF1385 domain-containing protein [Thermoleophilia bacterium]|nr:DUF1385 domain-containing protein [Acidobacteriota bacterium]HQF52415.1 DUF1385 domain-containing protein [Thermoleophilia bacterium]HQH20569.1 DUF1385 domain-containing protein [Thermoleophilia bacterium]